MLCRWRIRLRHETQQYRQPLRRSRRFALNSSEDQGIVRRAAVKLKSLPPPRPAVPVRRPAHRRIEIVTIGTSTGGPNAWRRCCPRFRETSLCPLWWSAYATHIYRLLADRWPHTRRFQCRSDAESCSVRTTWDRTGDFHMTVKVRPRARGLELIRTPPRTPAGPG